MTGNIVLTGFMGTGKSTIGRVLAQRLDRTFVDTDVLIESRHGPIAAIFASDGETTFRAHERQLADELAARDDLVIATGGGMLLAPDVATVMGRDARIFCLTASVETILDRVGADESGIVRPLLVDGDARRHVTELLAARQRRYEAFEMVATDGRTPDDVVTELLGRLEEAPPT